MLPTIWWAATEIVPMRLMKIAMRVKELTSKKIVSPMGTPRRSCAAMAFICGQKNFSGRIGS